MHTYDAVVKVFLMLLMVLLMLGMLLLMLRLLNEPAEQSPHASSKAQFGSFSVCVALKQFSMSSQSHAFFVTYVNETALDSCMNNLKKHQETYTRNHRSA